MGGLSEPPTDPRRARQAAAAAAWRTGGTKLCPYVRNGRDAKNPPARSSKHHQTIAHSRRRIQPEPDHEEDVGTRDTSGIPGQTECPSDPYSNVVWIHFWDSTTAKTSIINTSSNVEEQRNAFSITARLPEFRHPVFENPFCLGLLGRLFHLVARWQKISCQSQFEGSVGV